MKYKIIIDRNRDQLLTEFGKKTLEDRYLLPGEDYQDLFARVASAFANDEEHAQRLYDYLSKLWFMAATPILSNGGTTRGLPISCFLSTVNDSLEGIMKKWAENAWLASRGGGLGVNYSNLRSINEKVGKNGSSSGVISFIKVQDSLSLAISQGSLRRGSVATYLKIDHPEIIEFILMRKHSGGDTHRKALNVHHGIIITDDFMHAVDNDDMWYLKSPITGKVIHEVKARDLWIRILSTRVDTGEPYLLFIDNVNKHLHPAHQKLGLKVNTSNLCTEITLTTGNDHLGNDRTAVCCLSSLNLETYEEWKDDQRFFTDIMYFLDNVLTYFIENASQEMSSAVYAAMRERSIGLGVMGLHYYFQKHNIVFDSLIAKIHNKNIFKNIHNRTMIAAAHVTQDRGPCPDAQEAGLFDRFINKLSIAPTASISIIAGYTSASVEPILSNAFTAKTLSGSYPVRNKYLSRLIVKKGLDEEDMWIKIVNNGGSIQGMEEFTEEEQNVFKTAYEIDQRYIIDLAADRTQYICQAQSINLFFPADAHKKDIHQVHYQAWKKGLKSLYYLRSTSIQRPGNTDKYVNSLKVVKEDKKYEECLACQ